MPASAAPQGSICVALVVDFADIGGGVSTSCATVAAGSTGYDVLRAGGHTFTVCSNGVLGTIDGKPANGCAVKDSSHYWSYWHRAPGASGWTYSDEGAGSYQPANKSTEGWVWQNGSSRQPTAVPYSHICTATTAPTPHPTSTTQPPRTTGHRSSTTPFRAGTRSPAVAPTLQLQTGSPSRAAHRPARLTTSASTDVSTTPPATPAPSDSPSATTVAEPDTGSGSSGPPWALIVVAAAIVALGGAAVLRARRHRGET